MDCSRRIHRFGDNVERLRTEIDNGGAGDADLGLDVCAESIHDRVPNGSFSAGAAVGCVDEVGAPEGCARGFVGVEGVEAVVLGGDKNDVVLRAGDGEIGNPLR